jgi:hypothetical protein
LLNVFYETEENKLFRISAQTLIEEEQ